MRVLRRCVAAGTVLMTASLTACATTPTSRAGGGKIAVVAAENFWGSIAGQLGGDRVVVRSLVANPATDPHDYEPLASDGREIASARYVIVNGLGYDRWAGQLLAANPARGRAVLNVGDLAGLPDGANPHQWYSPVVVEKVIAQITADYQKLRPGDATYFDAQRHAFEGRMAPYTSLIAEIKATYAGTPVGASESVFAPLADALGLHLVTPASFLAAISEGSDPTASDKAIVDRQIASGAIKVFVFNRQNATPDVRRLVDAARANGIATTTVTETLVPRGATFQTWQVAQLRSLERALSTHGGA